ncbi:MAG TPA: plastocyanin/azurin family copper-binding protein [Solirubrobacterales bacterium]|nr:plastocyanin/azurin family copper-binding protein [Solirubrobacterales bacterium]
MAVLSKTRFVLPLAVVVLGLGACGGDDDDDDGTTTGASAGGAVEIVMDDYSFSPANATVPAGPVTITAPNEGKVEHELVLFKSDADPAKLPVSGAEADEAAFEAQGAEVIGEAEAEPGESGEFDAELEAGAYVMICNLPGHYQKGMYGSLTAE